MPEIANVADSETIESSWGNAIRDRTIQRYATVAARDSSHPAPVEGDLAYVASVEEVQIYDGEGWVGLLEAAHAGSTDHDGRYYTQTAIDNALALKADVHTHPYSGTGHGHAGVYEPVHGHPYLPTAGGTVANLTVTGSAGFGSDVTIPSIWQAGIAVDVGARRLHGPWEVSSPTTTTNSGLPSWRHLNTGDPYRLAPLVSSKRFKRYVADAHRSELIRIAGLIPLSRWQERGSPKDSPWISGPVAEDTYEIAALRPYVGLDARGAPLLVDPLSFMVPIIAAVQYLLSGAEAAGWDAP